MTVRACLPATGLALATTGLLACGGVDRPARARRSSPSALIAAAVTTPTGTHARGDYDPDEYESGKSDGDNDDRRASDRDNDADNPGGSYYDADDASARSFGHAASPDDRRAVTALIRRYYAAASAARGALACSLLSVPQAGSVVEDLGRSPGPPYYSGDTCARVMTKVFRLNSAQLRAYDATLRVTGVRVSGAEGIAVLGFAALPGRAISVLREHGRWTVNSLLDRELP